jgi:hypothetical protein
MQGNNPVAEVLAFDIRTAWNDLANISHSPVEQFEWWQACVDGLRDVGGRQPYFVNAEGKCLAIAPLVVRPGLLPRIEQIGVRQLHEPMDFIYASREALAQLCAQLVRQKLPIDLLRVPRHSPLLLELAQAFKGRGLFRVSATAPYPYLALDASWAEPESHFNAGRRSDFRRAMRHAEKEGRVEFELVTPDSASLDRLLAEAYEAELNGWKGARGSALAIDPVRADFYRRYFHECTRKGILRLAFMRIDGLAVAMQIGVEINQRLWLMKIGYNEAYAKMSPGSLLMLAVLRQATQNGVESIEFLGSVEPWTEMWTKTVRECVHIHAYPVSFVSVVSLISDSAAWLARRIAHGGHHVGA